MHFDQQPNESQKWKHHRRILKYIEQLASKRTRACMHACLHVECTNQPILHEHNWPSALFPTRSASLQSILSSSDSTGLVQCNPNDQWQLIVGTNWTVNNHSKPPSDDGIAVQRWIESRCHDQTPLSCLNRSGDFELSTQMNRLYSKWANHRPRVTSTAWDFALTWRWQMTIGTKFELAIHEDMDTGKQSVCVSSVPETNMST